jgi:hypothetical protein
MSSDAALQIEFGPAVMRGLLEYGPFETELALELGLSLWLHRSATSPEDARTAILELRTVIIEVSGLDPRTEPFPLIGRTVERDLVNLASYLGSLVLRAAASRGWNPEDLVELAVDQL